MQASAPSFSSVVRQILELRDKIPHAVALSFGDLRLSYSDLDLKAGQFAGYLTRFGIIPGSTVAICMERSFEWIVAALGILKAGAAYVPLDLAWPDSRLRFAVKDSGATILVAQGALVDRLQLDLKGIDPWREAAAISNSPAVACQSIQPESLAYVIYTSGSTGVPKGVEITHANLSNLVRWHQETFNVTQQDRASHLAGLGFDAAVWEIWPHLAAGTTVCLADDTVRSSPELMQQWIIREDLTIGFVPTVYASTMLAMEWPATTKLRILLTGGDTLHKAPAVPLPFDVVNNYGPTECTVVATSALIEVGSRGIPSIGRPISGVSIYLLNEHGNQVPDGHFGEIYIGGRGVGRGYRNLPDATARSFLHDPFATTPGARMYRTGDLGVRRTDGQIEFRGRLDRQTKIRGQRVELGEIDSILIQHPSIEFATTIAKVPGRDEKQLLAHILPKKNVSVPTAKELREYLLRSLPDYMIPAIFVRLDALPLSHNGKVDLTMLPEPTDANVLDRTAKAPVTSTEEKLLSIVQALLQNDAIGAGDNFFFAGGHSLLGMQLVLRLRTAFGVELTLRQLFEAPTVQRLALVVGRKLAEERLAAIWRDLLGLKKVEVDDNFFNAGGHKDLMVVLKQRIAAEFGQNLTMAELLQSPTVRQQAELLHAHVNDGRVLPAGVLALQPRGTRDRIFWIHSLSADLAQALGDDQPLFHVSLTADDFESLGDAPLLQSIAACLASKVVRTQSNGPYVVGGFCLGGIVAYEIACQLRSAGHEVSLLLLDTPSPSYYRLPHPLAAKLTHPRYLIKRAGRLGLRQTLRKMCQRPFRRFTPALRRQLPKTEIQVVKRMIEAAAATYQAGKYDGKMVLLLASERPPHVDFLPEWQELVSCNLHTHYLHGYHNDLTKPPLLLSVADVIASHVTRTSDEMSLSCGARQLAGDGFSMTNSAAS